MKTKAQKKAEIAAELKDKASQYPGEERMRFALQNGCSMVTMQRYFSGKVGNIALGESLLNAIKEFTKAKDSIAA